MLGLCLHSTSGGGGSGSNNVYYNRPYVTQTTIYNNYDEGYRLANGGNDYNDSIPTNSLIQEVSPDFVNGRYDYLRYTNKWGHKFRFTGSNGGYYDEADGNYYLADGTLSNLATVYPDLSAAGKWIVLDNLTGYAVPNDRGGAMVWTDAMNDVVGYDYFGYGSGSTWYNWTIREAMQLFNNSNEESTIFSSGNTNRPFFTYSQANSYTSTTRASNTAQANAYLCNAYSIGYPLATTKTGAINRWHFTIFDDGPITQ